MDDVYRVWGATLGDGACLLADSEAEAIAVVAGIFKLKSDELKAALDKTVSIPTRSIILNGDGTTRSRGNQCSEALKVSAAPADVIGNAVRVLRIATGEEEDVGRYSAKEPDLWRADFANGPGDYPKRTASIAYSEPSAADHRWRGPFQRRHRYRALHDLSAPGDARRRIRVSLAQRAFRLHARGRRRGFGWSGRRRRGFRRDARYR